MLALICVAQFVVVLDVTIVAIALPPIQRDLNVSATDLQWVVTAYTLVFAGFLVLAGRIADLHGRRRWFLVGLALFSASSLLCGVASSVPMLVSARCVQGLGAAVVAPAALSIRVLYLHHMRDLSPTVTGLAFAPVNLAVIAGSVVGPRLVEWVGNRRAMAAGLLMVAIGGAAIGAILDVRGQALVALVAAFVVLGGGLGEASVASTAQGIAAAGDARAGVASGILNTAAPVGTAVGLAVLVSLAAARTDVLSTTSTQQEALVGGYRWAAAAAAMLAGGTGAALLRSRHD